VTIVELLLDLFCAVTSRLKVGIYLVSLFQVIGDSFIDLRQGERRKVLTNFFRRRAFPEGMDHAVKGHTGADDTPGSLWGTDQPIRKIKIRLHKSHIRPANPLGQIAIVSVPFALDPSLVHFDVSRIPETWKFPSLVKRLERSVAMERLERLERLFSLMNHEHGSCSDTNTHTAIFLSMTV
jgi:hypothetical protein